MRNEILPPFLRQMARQPPSMRSVYDEVDWSATPLGPRESWPALLRLLVDLCLDSEFPVQVSWGPDLLMLYNDAYIPLLGVEKHPWALGRPAREVGPHPWPASEERLREVMETGRAYHSGDQRLMINRHGYPEEAYFTFSTSAIRDADGMIVGLFNAITETTPHILYERRLQVLRRLGAMSVTADDSLSSTCRAAVEVIGRNRKSVPFAAVYLSDLPRPRSTTYGRLRIRRDHRRRLRTGRSRSDAWTGPRGHAGWGQSARVRTAGSVSRRLRARTAGTADPRPGLHTAGRHAGHPEADGGPRPWSQPLLATGRGLYRFRRNGRTAARRHRHRRSFLPERTQRQLALAELDRARTEFFQNVTHELRAPLTMLLTPLQDILDEPGIVLPAATRNTVETSVRAGDRLQRVIEALLDLSRAESGALIPDREDMDLASVTADVVEGYRPATEDVSTCVSICRRTAPGVRRPHDVDHHRDQPGEQRGEVHAGRRGCGKPERRRQPGGPHGVRHRRRHSAARASSDLREIPPGQQ